MNKALKLLNTINELGGLEGYRSNTQVKAAWNGAFTLYRRDHPRNQMRSGCEACRKTVYNWLRTNAE